jgi:transcription elongation factor GreA
MINYPKVILTPQGKQKLEAELAQLKSERPQVVAELARARALGDLSENSAYHANKDKMRQVDHRIMKLKLMLSNSEVVEKTDKEEVQLGSRVETERNGEKVIFELVGENEADPKKHKISLHSPLGKAFMGRRKGEVVEVATPGGKIVYTISQID